MKVYAVSDPSQCVAIEQVRTGKWVPGTQVSVYHMGYDDEDRYEGSDHVSWDYSPNDGGGDTYTIDRNYTDSMYHHYSDVDYGHGAIGEKSQTFNSGDKFEGISNYGSGSKDGVDAVKAIEDFAAGETDDRFAKMDGNDKMAKDTNAKNRYPRCVTKNLGGQAVIEVTDSATAENKRCAIPMESCCTSGDCIETDENGNEHYRPDGLKCVCGSNTACSKHARCEECHISVTVSETDTYSGAEGGEKGYDGNNKCGKVEKEAKDQCQQCATGGCNLTTPCSNASEMKCPTHSGGGTWSPVATSLPSFGFVDNFPGGSVISETPGHWEEEITETPYCVNPDSPMSGSYRADYVDPSECAASNSSVDCGYLNILAEAHYNNEFAGTNISEAAVTMAMRFWGAYTQQGGYRGVGMGYHTAVLGSNDECTFDFGNWGDIGDRSFARCMDMEYLGEKGNENSGYLNIYKQTVKYILDPSNVAKNQALLLNGNIIDTSVSNALNVYKNIDCKHDGVYRAGVICGDDEDNHLKYAVALFYNTKQGNPNFQSHLNKVYGGLTTRPISVTIQSESGNTTDCTLISGKKEEDLTEKEKELKKYCDKYSKYENTDNSSTLHIEFKEQITNDAELHDCTEVDAKINQLAASGLANDEQMEILARIKEFCNVEVQSVRVKFSENDYIDYYSDHYQRFTNGVAGPVVNDPEKVVIGRIASCQKSSCEVMTKIMSPCDLSISEITATLSFNESKSQFSMKKYTDCGTQGVGNPEAQFLYSIYKVDNVDEPNSGPTIQEFDVTASCHFPCDPQPKISKRTCNEPKLSDFIDDSAYTVNDEYYYTDKGKKENKTKDEKVLQIDNAEYGDSYESSIKDPSLSCILNSSPTQKNLYDYSSYFGVNSDICRVFCSDEVHYYMADKTIVYSGLSYKYDIEYKTFDRVSINKPLSTIIQMRRNCVSEIYFDHLKIPKMYESLAKTYGLGALNEGESITNWVELYNKVLKNAKRDNNRNDQLKLLIYDLYNCNFFGKDVIEGDNYKIARPSDNTTDSIYDIKMPKIFADNYGFENCTINDDKNDCINLNGITYEGGSVYASGANVGSTKEVGDNLNTIDYKYTLSANRELTNADRTKYSSDSNRMPKISEVRYCKGIDRENNGCFSYTDANSFNRKYDESTLTGGEYDLPHERCNGNTSCRNIRYVGTHQKLGDSTIFMTVPYITNTKSIVNKPVPINDYAYFTITTEVGYYNDNKFASQAYTGKVYDITPEKNLLAEEKIDTLLKMSEYVYPASITTNECTIMTDDNDRKSTKYFYCDVKFNTGRTETYHRNFKNRLDDKFYKMINDQDENIFSCYYVNKYPFDVKDSEVVYRNVNLSNFFPANRTIGENWNSTVGNTYRSLVETYAKDNGDYQYYEDHKEYSYTLTQESLDLVRQYNSQVKDYKNEDTIPEDLCQKWTVLDSGKETYHDCKSTFLDNIDNYKIVDERPDKERGKSDYTVEEEQKKNNP